MVSETVETKLPRLCHARLSQLSKQTVDARSNYELPSIGRIHTGRSISCHNAFYGIGVSRFSENPFVLRFDGRFSKNEKLVGWRAA